MAALGRVSSRPIHFRTPKCPSFRPTIPRQKKYFNGRNFIDLTINECLLQANAMQLMRCISFYTFKNISRTLSLIHGNLVKKIRMQNENIVYLKESNLLPRHHAQILNHFHQNYYTLPGNFYLHKKLPIPPWLNSSNISRIL